MSKRIYEGAIRDIIAQTSGQEHGDTKKLLREFSTELFNSIRNGLLADGHVRLHKFGSFKLKWTKERKGKNPQTGEALVIPAHPRISFTAAKALKDRLISSPVQAEEIQPLKSMPTPINITNSEPKKESTETRPIIPPAIETPEPIASNDDIRRPVKKSFTHTSIAASVLLLILGLYFFNTDDNSRNNTHETQRAISEIKPAAEIEVAPSEKTQPVDTPLTQTLDDDVITSAQALEDTQTVAQSNPAFFTATTHKLVNGDSLWRLSKKNYINPFYWPHIYQANQYTIHNPDKLLIGKTITLPELLGTPDNLTDADRLHIAEGYFLVYKSRKKHNKSFPYFALLGVVKFDPDVIERHIDEIDKDDWNNLQLAGN